MMQIRISGVLYDVICVRTGKSEPCIECGHVTDEMYELRRADGTSDHESDICGECFRESMLLSPV